MSNEVDFSNVVNFISDLPNMDYSKAVNLLRRHTPKQLANMEFRELQDLVGFAAAISIANGLATYMMLGGNIDG